MEIAIIYNLTEGEKSSPKKLEIITDSKPFEPRPEIAISNLFFADLLNISHLTTLR
jgi:hypothetical protein